MWNIANFTEDSDDTKMIERQEIETESDESNVAQKYNHWRKQLELYHNVEQKCCYKCNQPRCKIESPELGRRRTRRTKDQVQHCPSCHCPPETLKYSNRKTNYPKNMDAVLNDYEDLMADPANQTIKKSQNNSVSPRQCRLSVCSHTPAYAHHHSRKRQTSNHRHQCRNEQDQMLRTMRNTLHSGIINDSGNVCYECPRSTKNSYKKENSWRQDQITTEITGTTNMDRDIAEKCTQHSRERILRSETRNSRQHVENMNKLNTNEKYELGDVEDDDCLHTKGRLRFNLKSDVPPNVLSSILRAYGSQTSPKNKNVEDSSKHKDFTIDASDHSKDEYLRSAIRLNSLSGPEKESTSNKEETRENARCESIVKDEEQEILYRKSNYAGGDLDLHVTKNYILDLIDQALSKKFATSPDRQKNAESKRELTEQGIYIEITRALQGDWCDPLAENLSVHCETNDDYIKRLKYLRSEHMKHIENEFKKLCNLQKFLDNYSPRQSVPGYQSHSGAVEQRAEEWQQQQHEEKQNLGTIS